MQVQSRSHSARPGGKVTEWNHRGAGFAGDACGSRQGRGRNAEKQAKTLPTVP